jgi:cytochrome c-type biogenesis protein CcmH
MGLWTVLALMTVAAVAAIVWPLARRRAGVAADPNDLAVYRDQLGEIERDRATGIIGAGEAEAARVEVSRRLISAADRMKSAAPSAGGNAPRRRLAAAAALVALPVGAVALYFAVGSPGLPDEPLAARLAAAHGDNSVQALFTRVEAHLGEHPDDGRGWEVIAPIYMDLGRFDDAVTARGNALRLLGASAEREAYYGEALTAAANGIVTAEAKAAFDRAIDRDRRDPTARYYQGVAAEQDGSRDDAKRIWRALLAEAPADAQWVPFVRSALARVEGAAAAPGPTAGASTAGIGDNEMIRGMVERLAARLRQDGTDADGWVRLARSYKVLGESARMEAAIADARSALAGDVAKPAAFEEGLKNLDGEPTLAPTSPPAAVAATPAPTQAPAEQDQMIRGMVERLAARLRQDGSDVPGWIMLVRSYLVLGERERAEAAATAARAAVGANGESRQRLEEGLKTLEVRGELTQQGKVQ